MWLCELGIGFEKIPEGIFLQKNAIMHLIDVSVLITNRVFPLWA